MVQVLDQYYYEFTHFELGASSGWPESTKFLTWSIFSMYRFPECGRDISVGLAILMMLLLALHQLHSVEPYAGSRFSNS